VAARGLDVEELAAVFNYELPTDTDTYTHRIGRTAGRAAGACRPPTRNTGGACSRRLRLLRSRRHASWMHPAGRRSDHRGTRSSFHRLELLYV